MKGIAPVMLLLAGLLITTGAAVISTFYSFSTEPATSSNDPVEIVGTAAVNVPWNDLWDLFFGGLLGVLIWLDRYLLWPLLNWVANVVGAALGWEWGRVQLPLMLAHVIMVLLIAFTVWKKKDQIWEFITGKLLVVIVFLSVVFVVGVVLAYMGAIG